MKEKQYTYPTWVKVIYKDDNEDFIQTQLYSVGVYAIINNDPALQFTITPKSILNMVKKLKKSIEQVNSNIKEVQEGATITVSKTEFGYKLLN